ncbi:TAXI family TRAP transporter solute-binding subunit [Brevibacillus porteri]|uniref:C4-dicarboxylate ABC transporter substrate-binding protein n=1 Tax=Brevibacillus porteri TaxID=2126350 RepID=A0ABX5FUW2_9BACL|nr:TAXI family TRAP transporter solute-binding subunit [Brevibacillus porteri]MED1797284.1 TAXI family TRAP transporter solute-binding subunit [Brevibacillus porteri]MED2129354.1 TAXI family TRAP transporter solute-binding subunit [Brevibacillus porteri]MED2743053.1 TAXI family TRAP transporter solute-binding subunit [Brevibacillus porteri]MED2817794.1 TAXI family TRAP transporter solute-binding subunit [Brevibacillus porteri]MED2896852.1 TAXI family TRAP transporter solute-binding subunit [Br
MKKRHFLLSLTLLLSMSLITACGGGNSSQGGAGGGADPSQLIIATGGTGGTYFPLGGGMADHITKNAGLTATAQATGASAENIRLLRDKKADIAFTQNDIAEYASKGTNMFQQDGKIDSFQALGALYDETIQIVVSADSNIKSVGDLKDKRVSVGAPGSGTEVNAQQILEAYGMTFEDTKLQRLSFADSAKAIQDGQLDAAFQTAGTPTAAITELAATTGVKIIPIDADKIDAIIAKYPYYVKTNVPANTYQTVPEEVTTVSVKSMLLIRSDLSEGLVYKVTKAIFENSDKLGHAKAKEIKLENVKNGVSIPVHPGAQKYFDEKGVK